MSKPELDTLIEAIKAGQISTDIIMTAFGHGWDDIRVPEREPATQHAISRA